MILLCQKWKQRNTVVPLPVIHRRLVQGPPQILKSADLHVPHIPWVYVSIITLNVHGLNAPTKDIDWLNEYKIKTHIYTVYKRTTSDLGTHKDWKFSSVQFSRSVVSNSLRPHESQHARPPCPSPTPGVHSDSHPSSRWCHQAISSSVVPFSSCPQSLSASQSFPMSQLFAWGGQSTGVSASVSFLPKNTQGWSPSKWTGWISLQCKGLSRVFSNTTVQKHQFFSAQPSSQSNSHIHTWPQEKP